MRRAARAFTVIIFAFLYIPMLVLAVASLNQGSDLAAPKGFTTGNYLALFKDSVLLPLLLNSVLLALASSLCATALGTAAALGINRLGPRLRRAAISLTNIPLTNPEIVTGVSLALLFAFVGHLLRIKNVMGFATLLIAHITFNLPYVILSVLPKLRQMDSNLYEAALDLGCTPFRAFFKVILHEILPGVVSGALMAFTMSLDDFVISYFVYGAEYATLPMEIYNYTKKPLQPKIYALFTLLFIAILLLMILMNILQAKDNGRGRLKNGALSIIRRLG